MDSPSSPTPETTGPEHTPGTLPTFTPVPRATNRHNGWKPEVQHAFIAALAETGSVKAACRRIGRSDNSAYQLRRHPEAHEFRAAWDAALDLGVRRIEDAAMDRALYGTEETIHYHGEHVATRRRYNERLVMFLLRNRAPDRFTEGRPKALNAVDEMQLKRLKKQWRAEWEAQEAANHVSPAEVRASIDRKLAALKAQTLAYRSPAAYERKLAEHAQIRADLAAGWRPDEPYAPYAARAAELLPHMLEQVRREWPPYETGHLSVPDEDPQAWLLEVPTGDDDDDDEGYDDDDAEEAPTPPDEPRPAIEDARFEPLPPEPDAPSDQPAEPGPVGSRIRSTKGGWE